MDKFIGFDIDHKIGLFQRLHLAIRQPQIIPG